MEDRVINIFLADDDEDDRIFFREAISNLNIKSNLIMVDDGAKAIKHFANPHSVPDFVFLDINMPVKNGLESLKFIKELYPEDNFHIVILSTSIADKDINFSYQHGASAYIQKPSSFTQLTKYLDYCLNRLSFSPDFENFILSKKEFENLL